MRRRQRYAAEAGGQIRSPQEDLIPSETEFSQVVSGILAVCPGWRIQYRFWLWPIRVLKLVHHAPGFIQLHVRKFLWKLDFNHPCLPGIQMVRLSHSRELPG